MKMEGLGIKHPFLWMLPFKPKLTSIQSRILKSKKKKKRVSPPSRIDSPKRIYQRSKTEKESR